ESWGYTVLESGTGQDALDLLAQFDGTIDLMLTDVVMPGMNGRELAAHVAATYPGIKVVYTSGYTDDVVLRRGVLSDANRFIGKPYTGDALRRKIRDVLDE
ncbi:MAG: response regulator, partial [Acidobacteria bacterium]|nr:response regulator [Acidobacteriota bacterium]